MIGNFPTVLNFNRLFLKLNRFICNYQYSPIIGERLECHGLPVLCWAYLQEMISENSPSDHET